MKGKYEIISEFLDNSANNKIIDFFDYIGIDTSIIDDLIIKRINNEYYLSCDSRGSITIRTEELVDDLRDFVRERTPNAIDDTADSIIRDIANEIYIYYEPIKKSLEFKIKNIEEIKRK